MPGYRSMRASDAERETAVDLLSQAFAEGRLSHHELGQRCTAALTARTRSELSDLTADLPVAGVRTELPADQVTTPGRTPARSHGRAARCPGWPCWVLLAAGLAWLFIAGVIPALTATIPPVSLSLFAAHVVYMLVRQTRPAGRRDMRTTRDDAPSDSGAGPGAGCGLRSSLYANGTARSQ